MKSKENIDKKETLNDKKNSKGFFKKIWYSITKIEKYPEMAVEGTKKSIFYLAKLVIIIAVVLGVWITYQTYDAMNKGIEYIKNDFPNFSYKDGQLQVENNDEPITIQNNEVGKIIVDTKTDSEEEINKYINSVNEYSSGIIITKNRILLKNFAVEGTISYNYNDVLKSVNITEFTKDDIINYSSSSQTTMLYINVFLTLFVYSFIMYFITTISYVILISLLGSIASLVLKMKMRYQAMFNMSVYAITLSVILNIIYLVVNMFTNFVMEYFQVMYVAVATIYLIAAILIMKSEFIKRQAEVMKIVEAQKIVKKELENKEEENKKGDTQEEPKDNKEKEDEKKEGEEPEGQNA